MVDLKSAAQIAKMRESGRVVATALQACKDAAKVGVSLRELDEVARRVLKDAGATSSFLDYHPRWAPTPFPGVICASVNDVVVHGIPGEYELRDGDLLGIDFGAELAGYHGDSAISFVVGAAAQADLELIAKAEEALAAGIARAKPGGRLGDISHAIGTIGRAAGYGLPAGFGGHGIGRAMHEDPSVPNEGRAGRGLKLKPGLVIAIEPMFMAGGRDHFRMADDGWSMVTGDGSRAAHVEHTVAITADGPQILTLP